MIKKILVNNLVVRPHAGDMTKRQPDFFLQGQKVILQRHDSSIACPFAPALVQIVCKVTTIIANGNAFF